MKILHVGSSSSPQAVDGVNTTIWLVAREQALLGHQVTLLLDAPPVSEAAVWSETTGIQFQVISSNTWQFDQEKLKFMLRTNPPDLVHMHSVFLPKQATLALTLTKFNIPYVITPNAMHPELLRRGWLKKSLYSWVLEKPRFSRAAAIAAVTPREADIIKTFIPNYTKLIRWIPNPINVYELDGQTWEGNVSKKRLIYLGRYDVIHKGIDIMTNIARFLPLDIEIHLYGRKEPKTAHLMKSLEQHLPPNMHLHNPIYRVEKAEVIAQASLYLQTSRWEVFGISVAEAMYLGVPCAIAATMNLADLFQQHDLGLVLPTNPKNAADRLAETMSQPAQLHRWSEQARSYAQQHFHPKTVALKYLALYEEAIQPG